MAKLNTPLQVQSSFPQLAQQYATTIQRNKVMQERERKQLQAESKQEARVQGALTAGVEGLQANTGLYGIGQSLYQDYITAEESGDVEGAEVIKNYLDKFMTSSAGYIRSEQNLLSGILNDPAKLSQFEDSSSDVVNAAETNTLKKKGISMLFLMMTETSMVFLTYLSLPETDHLWVHLLLCKKYLTM